MGKRFQFKSIGARLIFWFFIMAIIPLIMVNIAIYIHMVHSIKVSAFNKIEAMRDLKVLEVESWLNERITDIRTIAASEEIRILEQLHNEKENVSQSDVTIVSKARNLLSRYLQYYDDFDEISIISSNTKIIMVSSDQVLEGEHHSNDVHVMETLQARDVSIADIHYSNRWNKPGMALSVPVFGLSDKSQIIAVLVAGINLEASLYKMLLNRTGVGETGETLIVNKNVMALNKLRWYVNTPLTLKITSEPAVHAARGETGIMETADYRGEKTLAAYTFIPRTGWGFVAKQDLEEVYAPIYRLRKWMLAIVFMTLLGVIINTFLVSRSISNPIKALHKGSEIIGNGNLDHKVGTDASDEIGELSRTFDLMIETLKTTTASWDDLNKEMAERRHLEKMLLEFREHERRRIGHDLHDNLGQQLTAISYKTQGLENRLRKKMIPEAEDAARITSLIEMAKTQVKSLSKGLSPMLGQDEYSLMAAVVDLAANSEKLFGIPCIINCSKPVPIYNEAALLHLYRIAQEAVTNAARHAKPGQIEISIIRKHDNIILAVKDNGKGFALPAHYDGIGLEIMKYRARIINASLDIRPDREKGTVVTCIFRDKREREVNVNKVNV
ncbi:MAG: HAMP domain-containing protein [Nitrospiraceae bacterium]|nr:MAG: HAMP domain-containing protein [Nitrospiraceae bacterium]